jgi:hypothetical protein
VEADVASPARSYCSVEDEPPASEGAQEASVRQVDPWIWSRGSVKVLFATHSQSPLRIRSAGSSMGS